jgi:transposase
MAAKPSSEVKTRIVNNTQENGDIYVLERKIIYDPVTKNNKVLSTKLMSKIPKGTETPVPTRPKRPKSQMNGNFMLADPDRLIASRKRIGMMDIIGHIGRVSGIDDSIYANTDMGTAQKIISLARYLLGTNGQSLPGILTWQYNHPLPYAEGITEDIYHDLFRSVGYDETLQQNFFLDRCAGLGGKVAIAYDSTTISTYSVNQDEARFGFSKSGDGLRTIKYLTLYSIDTRQPIAYTKQPGNLPDVITIGEALSQLMALGVSTAELVTDNGYYSEKNLSELLQAGFDFITLAKTSLKWIRPEIDSHIGELGGLSRVCPFDHSTRGVSVMLMREFVKIRKYGSVKSGLSKGDEEIFRRRVYLHIFFSAARKVEEDESFESELISIKKLLEEGKTPLELSEAAMKKADKYLVVKARGKTISASYDEKACAEAKKYHGFFALVSNSDKDAFSALEKYRKREYIENHFKSVKQNADGNRARVWDANALRGRMFVQFIALCYYEFLSEEVRKMKADLGVFHDKSNPKTKKQIDLERKLRSWLENTPIYLQLQWFDVIEGVEISSKLKSARWSTPITSRDKLYLERLGMEV